MHGSEVHSFTVVSKRWLFCQLCVQWFTGYSTLVTDFCRFWCTYFELPQCLTKMPCSGNTSWLVWLMNLEMPPTASRWCFVFFCCIDENFLFICKVPTTVAQRAHSSPLDPNRFQKQTGFLRTRSIVILMYFQIISSNEENLTFCSLVFMYERRKGISRQFWL